MGKVPRIKCAIMINVIHLATDEYVSKGGGEAREIRTRAAIWREAT
jgi:hypothetical protein